MRFRYFDGQGGEVEVSTVEALAFRIQTGAVQPDTLLFDAAVGEWCPAGDHPVFQFVQDEDAPLGDSSVADEAPSPPAPEPGAPSAAEAASRKEARPESRSPGQKATPERPPAEAGAAPGSATPSPTRARPAPASFAPLDTPEGMLPRTRPRVEGPAARRARRRRREARSALAGIGGVLFLLAGIAVFGLSRMGSDGWSTLDQALSLSSESFAPVSDDQGSAEGPGGQALSAALALPTEKASAAAAGPPTGEGSPPPPRDVSEGPPVKEEEPRLGEARLEELAADVLAAASGDLAVTVLDLQAALEVPERPPEAWMEGIYLAEAGRFPGARTYWERVGHAVSVVRTLENELFRGFVKDHVGGMGLQPEDADVLSARVLQRFAAGQATRRRLYDRLESLAHEAVELHDLLVRRTAAIDHEPFTQEGLSRDPVIEAVPDDPELAQELWDRMDRLFDLLDEVHGIGPVSTLRLRDALLEGIRPGEGGPGA